MSKKYTNLFFRLKTGASLILLISLIFLLAACSSKSKSTENSSTKKDPLNKTEKQTMKEKVITPTATVTPTIVPTKEEVKKDIKEITFSDQIPEKYLSIRTDHSGTIEHISYPTKDYFGDGSKITKNAYVYLPDQYDKSKKYNVLYLMHGIGGNEKEWGMIDNYSNVKIMMDNLAYYGDIEPFIIVVPNGRSSKDFANTSSDYNSFYVFGKELRNDLIPYIESKYSTYAEYDKKGYDLSKARDHRAMAGLSMGGMQTINIGICESLDIISYFGAFSACPTTNPASKIATSLKNFPNYNINYFYNICGTEDGTALASASAAVTNLTSLTDKLTDGKNFVWQTVGGGHDFNVWYLGFYNFARVAFQ